MREGLTFDIEGVAFLLGVLAGLVYTAACSVGWRAALAGWMFACALTALIVLGVLLATGELC